MAKHKKKNRSSNNANLNLEKAFLYMLAIPVIVLSKDYWCKTAKKKSPEFIDKCLEMFSQVENGTLSNDELAKSLHDIAGVKLSADWLKYNKE